MGLPDLVCPKVRLVMGRAASGRRPVGAGVDDHLVTFGGDEHDDFEQVDEAIGTDDQPSVGVLAQVVDDHRVSMAWRMSSSVMPWRRADRVDVHTAILYYEILLGVSLQRRRRQRRWRRAGRSSGGAGRRSWWFGDQRDGRRSVHPVAGPGVEDRDECRPEHVRMDGAEPSALADRTDPAMGGSAIEALAVTPSQDRPLGALADSPGRGCGRFEARAG